MVSAKFGVSSGKSRGNGKGNDNATLSASDKQKAMELALSQVEKQFGKGAIMRLGESHVVDVEIIPTGCISLGRVIEMFGPSRRERP